MAQRLWKNAEEEWLEQGERKGKLEEIRGVLLRQGRKRFGEPDEASVKALGAITDLDRLERMGEAILDVASWAELLATT